MPTFWPTVSESNKATIYCTVYHTYHATVFRSICATFDATKSSTNSKAIDAAIFNSKRPTLRYTVVSAINAAQ